mmetsp:Transcript_45871/g.90354  ORF Transcript_45871/g.90354 Transcript_45871/m.90354 type:complete len:141 (-) Transcript_45871:1899-2321(-)
MRTSQTLLTTHSDSAPSHKLPHPPPPPLSMSREAGYLEGAVSLAQIHGMYMGGMWGGEMRMSERQRAAFLLQPTLVGRVREGKRGQKQYTTAALTHLNPHAPSFIHHQPAALPSPPRRELIETMRMQRIFQRASVDTEHP